MGAHAAQPASSTASTTSEPLEEVVVTGFRASLADALQNKRESNQIIESVSAEDLGKFPDQNVAESLQRLPGISIDRSNGQGTKARIRGLDFFGPDHVLFGTDCPFVPEGGPGFIRETIRALDTLDLTDTDRARIYHGNVLRLMRLPERP